MKRFIAIVLCFVTVLSFAACGNKGEEYPTEPTKDYSEFAGIVADTTTWLENFEKLPIANEDMTEDELRKLCVDAFKADLTFQWTPNTPITYTYTLGGDNFPISLDTGRAYSGLCYATGVEGASTGNIHKILSYYDKATGTLDIEAMGDKFMGIITSACSFGALQGWNRVINSHGLTTMSSYNAQTSNIVPVGPYTYTNRTYNGDFGSDEATTLIIKANGDQTIYESYAAMKPADGFYSSPSWHVMMCSIAPVVVRTETGHIDPFESYLHLCEQTTAGTRGYIDPIQQENGKDLVPLGVVDRKVTFQELLQKGYIPFTFKEFLGEDPIEAGKAWLGNEAMPLANGTDISASALGTKILQANYVINNIIVTVKNPDGKTLYAYDPAIQTGPQTYQTNLTGSMNIEKLTPYANGKNTIHIMVQLANGELIDAFNTVLKVD